MGWDPSTKFHLIPNFGMILNLVDHRKSYEVSHPLQNKTADQDKKNALQMQVFNHLRKSDSLKKFSRIHEVFAKSILSFSNAENADEPRKSSKLSHELRYGQS